MSASPISIIRRIIPGTLLSLIGAFLVQPVCAQAPMGGIQISGLTPRAQPAQAPAKSPSPQRPAINLTLVDPGPIGIETTTLYFAQVAVGGGFSTIFTLLNTGNSAATGNLILTAQDGSNLVVNLESAAGGGPALPSERIEIVGNSIPVNIPAGGTAFITATPASPGDPTRSGWARLVNDGGSMGGVGTFQVVDGQNRLTTIAGVLASRPVPFATIPVDDDDTPGVDRFTGYAVANPSNEPINVRVYKVTQNGATVTEVTTPALSALLRPLGARRQSARFLFQDVPANQIKFRGSMVLVAEGGKTMVVVALVLNQGLFTAIPVINEKAPNVPN